MRTTMQHPAAPPPREAFADLSCVGHVGYVAAGPLVGPLAGKHMTNRAPRPPGPASPGNVMLMSMDRLDSQVGVTQTRKGSPRPLLQADASPPQGGHGRLGVALELRAYRVAELQNERLRDVVTHLRAIAFARDEPGAVQDAELLQGPGPHVKERPDTMSVERAIRLLE